MMTKHYCKECYKSIVDDKAVDAFMLMSEDDQVCPCCGKTAAVVGEYFSYGQHRVTPDGKHIVGESRHVGINPNYTFWGNCYPYADVENWRGDIVENN